MVLSDLPGMVVERVYAGGRLVARDGAMLAPLPRALPADTPRGTVRIPPQPPEAFALRPRGVTEGRVRLPVVGGARVVRWAEAEVEVTGGVAAVPPGHALIAVLHRHGRRDPSPVVCLADGWGEPRGAVATTISHDNHNLLVLGRDPRDMAAAANALIACGGGMAVARDGAAVAVLPLPRGRAARRDAAGRDRRRLRPAARRGGRGDGLEAALPGLPGDHGHLARLQPGAPPDRPRHFRWRNRQARRSGGTRPRRHRLSGFGGKAAPDRLARYEACCVHTNS